MAGRTKDQTRYKKTYSYARQAPVQQEVINAARNGNKLKDVSRFKKTYLATRQQPVVLQTFLQEITTETGVILVTESNVAITIESS